MKTLSLGIFLCLFSAHVYASGGRSVNDTSLIDINQNLLFRPELTSFQSAPSYKTASVHFIVSKDNKLGFEYTEPSFQVKTTDQCKTLGFEKTGSCGVNEYKAHTCPWDETRYDYCCDLNYSYTAGQCSYPRTLSSDSCGGKFKCYCDRALYPETSCSAPYIPSDDKCRDTTYNGGATTSVTYYAACVCPDNWVQCDSSIHQKGNGTACTYRGKTTYESCGCEGGYTQTCDDFGPRTPSDYCFLKGTKYYKDCKTGNEICEGMGFKHSASNPCSDDETIGDYCPKDGTYYSCKIDPVKYCKNHGYSNAGCAKYETVSSDVCEYDSSYKKCIPTCKSRLAELGYYELNDKLWYKNRSAVVWDDIKNMSLKNPQGEEYTEVNGPRAFRAFEECTTWQTSHSTTKPNLTIKPDLEENISEGNLLVKDLDNVKVTIDHTGTPSGTTTYLKASGTWSDVDITETNTLTMGTNTVKYGNYSTAKFYHMKNDTEINVYGDLYLKGNNTFTASSFPYHIKDNSADAEFNEDIGFYHLELKAKGAVHIEEGKTEFVGVPILMYKALGSFNIASATFSQLSAGFGIEYESASLNISDSTARFLYIYVQGDSDTAKNLTIKNSNVGVIEGISLYASTFLIKGDSAVSQGNEGIFVWNKSRICVAPGSTLCSHGTEHCVSGKTYKCGKGKGKYDEGYAGYSDWYYSTSAKFIENCGSSSEYGW